MAGKDGKNVPDGRVMPVCDKGERDRAMRVSEHPVLGALPEAQPVTIYFDGQPIEARAGEPIAAALMNAGIRAFRTTAKRHEKRGIFCAIGRCTDCMMIVDGVPNTRTCVTLVRDGMRVETQHGLAAMHTGEDKT